RRHARCYRDWSSDVCSSDLLPTERETERVAYALSLYSPLPAGEAKVPPQPLGRPSPTIADPTPRQDTNPQAPPRRVRSKPRLFEIGRASCRERVAKRRPAES